MERDYHDYVIKDGRFIGKFEEMYQDVEDPWHHGDATALRYDVALAMLKGHGVRGPIKVLDIGCGKGAFTSRLGAALPEASILALDISPTAIGKAREKYGSRAGTEFRTLDILKEDIGAHDFDLAVVSELFWYVLADVRGVIAKIRDKVKDGGKMLVSQTFYDPRKQRYGREIMQNEDDLLGMLKAGRVLERAVVGDPKGDHVAIMLLEK